MPRFQRSRSLAVGLRSRRYEAGAHAASEAGQGGVDVASSRRTLEMRMALAYGVWAGRFLTATVTACCLVVTVSRLRGGRDPAWHRGWSLPGSVPDRRRMRRIALAEDRRPCKAMHCLT